MNQLDAHGTYNFAQANLFHTIYRPGSWKVNEIEYRNEQAEEGSRQQNITGLYISV